MFFSEHKKSLLTEKKALSEEKAEVRLPNLKTPQDQICQAG